MQFNTKTILSASCALAIVGGLFASVALAGADDNEKPVGLPAPVLVRAINAANAAKAGTIAEVSVEQEKGQTLISIDVLATDGQKYEVNVEPSTGKVLSVAVDKEDDEKEGKEDSDGEQVDKD